MGPVRSVVTVHQIVQVVFTYPSLKIEGDQHSFVLISMHVGALLGCAPVQRSNLGKTMF